MFFEDLSGWWDSLLRLICFFFQMRYTDTLFTEQEVRHFVMVYNIIVVNTSKKNIFELCVKHKSDK